MNRLLLLLTAFCITLVAMGQGQIKRPKNQQQQSQQDKRGASTYASSGEKRKNQHMISVSEPDGYVNGHGYIDLGLPSGNKWSFTNIGASSPSTLGDYYAFGEISVKNIYISENAQTYNREISDISGSTIYDVATVKWGHRWRIPSRDDMQELVDYCKWEWVIFQGVNGYKVTGKNNKSIFLPAAGHCDETRYNAVGKVGLYRTSTPYSNGVSSYDLFFSDSLPYVAWYGRDGGYSIRPISN